MSKEKVVLIAASGSGGHLLPAVAIASELQASKKVKAVFIGSGRRLEETIIDGAGFRREVIKIEGIKRKGLRGIIRFIVLLPNALRTLNSLISQEAPVLVIGVGGYVSVLPVLYGRLRGIPSIIHEAEATPGLANKLLSLFASKITAAHPKPCFFLSHKVVHTGHPVARSVCGKEGPVETPRHLLIVGGSLGAQALDSFAKASMELFTSMKLKVVHQCRPENVESLRNAYLQHGIEAEVVEFIHNMPERYQWAHVCLARAGAGLVRELSSAGIPSILVPLPGAEEQKRNAQMIQAKGQALLVEEGDSTDQMVANAVKSVFTPALYTKMWRRPEETGDVDAARRIADVAAQVAHL